MQRTFIGKKLPSITRNFYSEKNVILFLGIIFGNDIADGTESACKASTTQPRAAPWEMGDTKGNCALQGQNHKRVLKSVAPAGVFELSAILFPKQLPLRGSWGERTVEQFFCASVNLGLIIIFKYIIIKGLFAHTKRNCSTVRSGYPTFFLTFF